jgi:hypothetical protein
MKTALRFAVVLFLVTSLVGCAGRQYTPSTPPEVRIAGSLDALAHVTNAVAKETVVLKQQGKLTAEVARAIAAWCRQVDIAVPRAFNLLKAATVQDMVAALSAALAEVAEAKPLKELIARHGSEPEMQAAIALSQSVLLLVREFMPEVANGK